MNEILQWENAKDLMKEFGLRHEVYSDRVVVHNTRGIILGTFYSSEVLVNYLHGYYSGYLDYLLIEEKVNAKKE